MSIRRLGAAPSSSFSLLKPFTTNAACPTAPSSPSFLTHHLLDEFSRPRASRDAARLRRLAASLTAPAAESVILRLPSWRHALDFFRWAAEQPGFRHSCYSLNAMASLLPRHAPAHLDRLVADALAARCAMTPSALGFLLRRLGAAGLPDTAARVFDQARTALSCTPNPYAYNCLLEALARAGRVDDAEARLCEMVAACGEESVDRYTLTSLLQCYCNAGRPDDANAMFQRMSERGWVDEHVLTTLLVAFSKWGKVEGAVELVGRMEMLGMRPSEKTLSVLIHGFAKQGRVDMGMVIFDKMANYGFSVDLPMYSVLIEGLCQGNEISKAVKLFEQMKRDGFAPDVRLLKKIVEAFCNEGDFAIVGRFISENSEHLKPTGVVSVYNVVLEGLVKCGEVEAAYRLLRSMMHGGQRIDDDDDDDDDNVSEPMLDICEDVKLNSDSFNIVVCGLCKVKKLDLALSLTRDMIGLGCKGKLFMFNDLVLELCILDRKKDPGAAIDLMREMRGNGYTPWIKNCTEMVQQLSFSGRITEALQFLDEMLKIGFLPDIVTYSAALNGMSKMEANDMVLISVSDVLVSTVRFFCSASSNICLYSLCT
ncbi:hypothetical protein QOZ80_5BG0425020 [Eleusine coracana subsp. coracana]|nr:hypothetical protein QOZ80_5BG0425020 [Eleusine coracana subsp. coracana]